MSAASQPSVRQKPKLPDRVRAEIRSRHFLHGNRHPSEMGAEDVTHFSSVLAKLSSSLAFRPSFATYPAFRGAGYLSAVRRKGRQELLGHKDVTTATIYTHVLNRGSAAPGSRRMGAAAWGRRVLGPLARPITRLEPTAPILSGARPAHLRAAAQPPPR